MNKPVSEREYLGRGIFFPPINIKDYIYQVIKEKGSITRSGLVKETGVPRTTIYDALIKLIIDEKIKKFSVPSGRRGRPRIFYEIMDVK